MGDIVIFIPVFNCCYFFICIHNVVVSIAAIITIVQMSRYVLQYHCLMSHSVNRIITYFPISGNLHTWHTLPYS
jgi:hypothetical protein